MSFQLAMFCHIFRQLALVNCLRVKHVCLQFISSQYKILVIVIQFFKQIYLDHSPQQLVFSNFLMFPFIMIYCFGFVEREFPPSPYPSLASKALKESEPREGEEFLPRNTSHHAAIIVPYRSGPYRVSPKCQVG